MEPLRDVVVRALKAIADEDPHRERRVVEALVRVLDELDAGALASGTTKRKPGAR